jgi:hypothetical protein
MTSIRSIPWVEICPMCGGVEVTTEPLVDEDGARTGTLIASCVGGGRELGEAPPLPPASETEPEIEQASLAPTEDEERRRPVAPRRTTHP